MLSPAHLQSQGPPLSSPSRSHRLCECRLRQTPCPCIRASLKNKKALASILSRGRADILSLLLACEPLLLTGPDLPRCRDASTAKGHVEMAALLPSIIEKQDLVATLSPPADAMRRSRHSAPLIPVLTVPSRPAEASRPPAAAPPHFTHSNRKPLML